MSGGGQTKRLDLLGNATMLGVLTIEKPFTLHRDDDGGGSSLSEGSLADVLDIDRDGVGIAGRNSIGCRTSAPARAKRSINAFRLWDPEPEAPSLPAPPSGPSRPAHPLPPRCSG